MYLLSLFWFCLYMFVFIIQDLPQKSQRQNFTIGFMQKNPSSEGKNIGENSANMVDSNACSISLHKACFSCVNRSLYQLYTQNQDCNILEDRQVKFNGHTS